MSITLRQSGTAMHSTKIVAREIPPVQQEIAHLNALRISLINSGHSNAYFPYYQAFLWFIVPIVLRSLSYRSDTARQSPPARLSARRRIIKRPLLSFSISSTKATSKAITICNISHFALQVQDFLYTYTNHRNGTLSRGANGRVSCRTVKDSTQAGRSRTRYVLKQHHQDISLIYKQSTAQVPSLKKLAKVMPALAVPTKPSARPHRKALIQISQLSPNVYRKSDTRSSCCPVKVALASRPSPLSLHMPLRRTPTRR